MGSIPEPGAGGGGVFMEIQINKYISRGWQMLKERQVVLKE